MCVCVCSCALCVNECFAIYYLVSLPEVELSRQEPFRNPQAVEHGTADVQEGHPKERVNSTLYLCEKKTWCETQGRKLLLHKNYQFYLNTNVNFTTFFYL